MQGYDSDYHQWLSDTVDKLRSRDFESVDWENVIEELESLGRSEKRACKSLLEVLLIHLLLLQYWQSNRLYYVDGWIREIDEFRSQLDQYLDSATLRNYLKEQLESVYQVSLRKTSRKLRTDTVIAPLLPAQCPFSFDEVLDPDYLPSDLG